MLQYSGRVINMAVGGVSRWARGMQNGLWARCRGGLDQRPPDDVPAGSPRRTGTKSTAWARILAACPEQRAIVHEGVEVASTPILLIHGIVDNHSVFAVLDRAPPPPRFPQPCLV